MLQLMLAGHQDIATTSEPWIALHPLFALRDTDINTVYDAGLASKAVRDFLKQSGVDDVFYKKQVAAFLVSFYNKALVHQNKKIFLDKTPRYYHIAAELMEVFPEAKFIFLIRNPIAVLISILRTWVGDNAALLRNYREDLLLAPKLLLDCINKYPESSHTVRYEGFVCEPEAELRNICRFLGVTFDTNMLDYGGRVKPGWKFGDPIGVFKSTRTSAVSAEAWKQGFFSPEEKLFANAYLEDLGYEVVKRLGYNFDEIRASIGPPPPSNGLTSWATIMNRSQIEVEMNTAMAEKKVLLRELTCYRNSLSWRLTAPLRRLACLLGVRGGNQPF